MGGHIKKISTIFWQSIWQSHWTTHKYLRDLKWFIIIRYYIYICNGQEFQNLSPGRFWLRVTIICKTIPSCCIFPGIFFFYSMFKHLIFKNVRTRFSSCPSQLYNTRWTVQWTAEYVYIFKILQTGCEQCNNRVQTAN